MQLVVFLRMDPLVLLEILWALEWLATDCAGVGFERCVDCELVAKSSDECLPLKWDVMWSRFTHLTPQPSHAHVRQRLLVDLRPMWDSHKWVYRSSGAGDLYVQSFHLQSIMASSGIELVMLGVVAFSSASDLDEGVNGDGPEADGGVTGSTDEAESEEETETVGGLR